VHKWQITWLQLSVYFKGKNKGGHEWVIEFEREPPNIEAFNTLLDSNLQKINSDYEAKRFKNMAMERLSLNPVPRGILFTHG
jgi:hypothetical protein